MINNVAEAGAPAVSRAAGQLVAGPAWMRAALLYIVLTVASLFMVVPFLWMLSTSLKSEQYILVMPPQLIPNPVRLSSYTHLAALFPILRLLSNSLLVAMATMVGQVLVSSMAAYAFARMEF